MRRWRDISGTWYNACGQLGYDSEIQLTLSEPSYTGLTISNQKHCQKPHDAGSWHHSYYIKINLSFNNKILGDHYINL